MNLKWAFFLKRVEGFVSDNEEIFYHRLVKFCSATSEVLYDLNAYYIPTLHHHFLVAVELDFKLLWPWVAIYYGAFHTLVQGSVFEKMVFLCVEQCHVDIKPTEVIENIVLSWN